MDNLDKPFSLAPGQMEAKQFGLNAEETLKFANWDTSSVAVIEAQLPKSVLNSVGDFTPVDIEIFKSESVTISGKDLGIINSSVIKIFEKY